MQIELVNTVRYEHREEFKISTLKRRWDILILVEDGAYSIHVKDAKKPFVLRKNEIAFLPAGTEFDRAVVSPITFYHIAFYSQADHPFRLPLTAGKLLIPEEQRVPIFKSMERAFLLPDNRELITHVAERILAENYLFGKSGKVNLRHLSEEIASTIRYMSAHLEQPINMDELAARVYLSHTGLIWKFKKELGTTPSQYLILLRLRYAKQLLLNHPYSVTEIAELCGYSNPYYFTNAFHRYSGMSPTEFRKYYLSETKNE